MKTLSIEEAKKKINGIVVSDYPTNQWEDEFIESILNMPFKQLTPKQTSCLLKIHQKAMSPPALHPSRRYEKESHPYKEIAE